MGDGGRVSEAEREGMVGWLGDGGIEVWSGGCWLRGYFTMVTVLIVIW